MSAKTLKYVIMEMDTRTTEFSAGVFAGLWAAWILVTSHDQFSAFQKVMTGTGGHLFWGVLALLISVFQLYTVHYKYPRWKTLCSGVSVAYWGLFGGVMLWVQPTMFIAWVALFWAIVSLWILTHRVATTP